LVYEMDPERYCIDNDTLAETWDFSVSVMIPERRSLGLPLYRR